MKSFEFITELAVADVVARGSLKTIYQNPSISELTKLQRIAYDHTVRFLEKDSTLYVFDSDLLHDEAARKLGFSVFDQGVSLGYVDYPRRMFRVYGAREPSEESVNRLQANGFIR